MIFLPAIESETQPTVVMQQVKPGEVDAVILAGGLGTRLKSVVGDRPKVLATFHRKTGAAISMVVAGARGRADGGTVKLATDGRIARFREKSSSQNAARTFINAGIYLMRRDLPASWRNTDPFSLERDIFPDLIGGGRCYGYAVDAEVVDIGTPKRYVAAQSKL